jgi:hypothetical protein
MLLTVLRSGKPSAEKNSQIIFFMLRCLSIGDQILHCVVQNLTRQELPFLIEVSFPREVERACRPYQSSATNLCGPSTQRRFT